MISETKTEEFGITQVENKVRAHVATANQEFQELRYSEERPCGDATLARLKTDEGGVLVFCAWRDGEVLVIETAPNGSKSTIDQFNAKKNGPLHLFRSVSGADIEPPALLIEKDEAWRINHPEEKTYEAPNLPIHRARFSDAADWCDNAQEWINDRCHNSGNLLDDVRFCGSGSYNRHQRTCSAYISGATPCVWAVGEVVSCGGRTKHKYYWRDRTSHSFKQQASIVVQSDEWNKFLGFSTDIWGDDYQFIGEDYDSSAWHRYYAGFEED